MNTSVVGETGKLKVTLWGINYGPESIGIAPFNQELAEFLASGGHAVTVVTAFPYYPRWEKQPGDRGRWHRAVTINGVRVHRGWCYVPAVVTTARRIAHELSFGLVSLWRVLVLPRADVYLVVSPPLALGFFAWIAATLKRSRFVFHVQDLQPDAAVGLGMIRPGRLVRALYRLEALAYAKAAVVSGISHGMMAAFLRKGVPVAKCVLLPNWLRLPVAAAPGAMDRAAARQHFGAAGSTVLAFYAGNLGRKQSLEILVEAAGRLAEQPPAGGNGVRLVIAGDGAARPALELGLRRHLAADVQLMPLLSDGEYAALLGAADVALITQAAGTGQFFFPSKLLSVLAAGLPVIAVADEDSELARAVRDGGFGCVVAPGDADGLASALRQLGEARAPLAGWAARTGWVRRFSRESILPRFERMLQDVAAGRATDVVEPVAPVPEALRDYAMHR